MPVTTLGKLCCRLGISSIGSFGLFFVLVASGQRGGDTFFSNPWLAAPMLAAVGMAVTGAFAGLAATARQGERAWSVFAFIALGLVVGVVAAVEVGWPH